MASRMWRVIILAGMLVIVLLAASACSSPASRTDGFSLRENYSLAEDQQLSGDQMIVAFDSIHLEPGSVITGKATLIGNEVLVDGEVTDDLVILTDRLVVGDRSIIRGDLIACAGQLAIQPGAQIEGDIKEECTDSHGMSIASVFESGVDGWRGNAALRFGGMVVGALLFGAMAALVTLIAPRPLIRIANALRHAPGTTGGFGFLTLLVIAGLTTLYLVSLLLVLPLILLPFVVLAWGILGVLSVLGWISLAEPLGNRVLLLLGIDEQSRMVAAMVGGIALTLAVRVWGMFWLTSWIGLLLTIGLSSATLGAVLLTRAGTRPFPRPR